MTSPTSESPADAEAGASAAYARVCYALVEAGFTSFASALGPIAELVEFRRAAMRAPVITEEMLTRFLCWKLPKDFSPDAGIKFKRVYNATSPFGPIYHEPTGTNLFNAQQARAMLEHVLGSDPQD